MASDQEAVVRIGRPAAATIGARARRAAAAAYARGGDPVAAALAALEPLDSLLSRAMLYAALKARIRARRSVPRPIAAAAPESAYRTAIEVQRKLAGLSRAELDALEESLGTSALRLRRRTGEAIERALREELAAIQRDGDHVREATRRIREVFANAGIVPENSYTAENIVRTQTALAYGAGKAQVEADPATSGILWGYTYSTVGDDRVRPSHAAVDGVTLPASDPFWQTWYPPNGYSCRCAAIPLYEPHDPVYPPAGATPDEGWAFHPSALTNALLG